MRTITRTIILLIACGECLAAEAVLSLAAHEFDFGALHKGDKTALLCYAVVDDETAESGKALTVRLNKQLVRKDEFVVLRASSAADLPVGLYRLTARVKISGMLSSLGSAIEIGVNGQQMSFYLNEFSAEDSYQDLVMDVEVHEADIVTQRPVAASATSRGPSNLATPTEQAEAEAAALVADAALSSRQRFVERVTSRLKPVDYKGIELPELRRQLLAAIDAAPGELLREDAGLPPEVMVQVNKAGASPRQLQVVMRFPVNTWGMGPNGTRGASTPAPSLRSVTIDRIEVVPLPAPNHIEIRGLEVAYHWRRPGESQRFIIWLHNHSPQTQTQTLALTIHHGLDGRQSVFSRPVTITAGRYALIEEDWQVPAAHRLWGQAAVATISDGDRELSSSRTWFTVHPFSNAVMIHDSGNAPRYYSPYGVPRPETQNHRELFGAACTIYDSAGVVPEGDAFLEPYPVGNGSYWMSLPTIKVVVASLQAHGIAPFFYLESNGSAIGALHLYWDHPDWVSALPANTDQFYLGRKEAQEKGWPFWAAELQKRNGGEIMPRAGGAYSGQLINFNGLIKENVDRVIEGTLRLLGYTGLAGVRWDGLPFKAANSKALGGDWGKTPEELAAISAANVVRCREEVRAQFPNFELRANHAIDELMDKPADPFDYAAAQAVMAKHPHAAELLRGHGSIMEEAWMGYGAFGRYTNNCRNYLRATRYESAGIQYVGGHHGHMLWFYDGRSDYTPDEIYQQVFSLLGGAHLDASFGPIPESRLDLGVYAARFSEYFWDPELEPISGLENAVAVDVDADIWYYDTGFTKITENGQRLYVLAFVNPPVTELWLRNRFGVLPEPITEPFPVSVAVPEDCTGTASVFLLDNRPWPIVRPLEFESDDEEVVFELPELTIFKAVAIRFDRGK